MNMRKTFSQKTRHGSISVAISAAVVCAVILVNVLVSALCSSKLFFIDLTTEPLYTLEEDTEFLLDKTLKEVDAKRDPKDPVQVDIIFCADPDLLCGSDQMRAVYYTALQIEKAFPKNVKVSTRDVLENPSSVDMYRTNAYTAIYPSYVIVASGTEFRVYTADAFYMYSTTNQTTPSIYSGERTFVKGIMAVTRVDAPICALTTNHGEPFATEEGRAEYSEFLRVIESAGYDVQTLDLAKEEIPENCRLIITFDPKKDFDVGVEGSPEIDKLNAFLNKSYAFMIFADADTPWMKNLEGYMEEWGVTFDRYNQKGNAYKVLDKTSALASEDGVNILAQYETEGVGGALTKDMREYSAPPKVVFGNALSISYSDIFEKQSVLAAAEAGTGAYTYGASERNGSYRNIYDLFRTTDNAYAEVYNKGEQVKDDAGNALYVNDAPFKLMTLTEHVRVVSEGVGYTNATNYSYLCAVGSVDFASNESLASGAFGNADVLLGVLRTVGKEVVPVGLDFKVLYKSSIDAKYNSQKSAVVQTVILTATPAVAVSLVGSIVLIKRKYRK